MTTSPPPVQGAVLTAVAAQLLQALDSDSRHFSMPASPISAPAWAWDFDASKKDGRRGTKEADFAQVTNRCPAHGGIWLPQHGAPLWDICRQVLRARWAIQTLTDEQRQEHAAAEKVLYKATGEPTAALRAYRTAQYRYRAAQRAFDRAAREQQEPEEIDRLRRLQQAADKYWTDHGHRDLIERAQNTLQRLAPGATHLMWQRHDQALDQPDIWKKYNSVPYARTVYFPTAIADVAWTQLQLSRPEILQAARQAPERLRTVLGDRIDPSIRGLEFSWAPVTVYRPWLPDPERFLGSRAYSMDDPNFVLSDGGQPEPRGLFHSYIDTVIFIRDLVLEHDHHPGTGTWTLPAALGLGPLDPAGQAQPAASPTSSATSTAPPQQDTGTPAQPEPPVTTASTAELARPWSPLLHTSSDDGSDQSVYEERLWVGPKDGISFRTLRGDSDQAPREVLWTYKWPDLSSRGWNDLVLKPGGAYDLPDRACQIALLEGDGSDIALQDLWGLDNYRSGGICASELGSPGETDQAPNPTPAQPVHPIGRAVAVRILDPDQQMMLLAKMLIEQARQAPEYNNEWALACHIQIFGRRVRTSIDKGNVRIGAFLSQPLPKSPNCDPKLKWS
ncbi:MULTISPECIES: hypothetical protein [unclassified Streptomyces]|uniref:hypothetical protein n=1 Tax=unclassified Streptomyces TaxID=2593676 RepID=UPI0034069BAB